MQQQDFHTLRGYERQDTNEVSPAMEDYLEMIYRCAANDGYARIKDLAEKLHVKPPSSSKMVARLRQHGLVDFEPYGMTRLTDKGRVLGDYLLHRHDVLNRFFCAVNHTQSELELVEKIEHFIDPNTVAHMEQTIALLQNGPLCEKE